MTSVAQPAPTSLPALIPAAAVAAGAAFAALLCEPLGLIPAFVAAAVACGLMFVRRLRMIGLWTLVGVAGYASYFLSVPESEAMPAGIHLYEADIESLREGNRLMAYMRLRSVDSVRCTPLEVTAVFDELPDFGRGHTISFTHEYTPADEGPLPFIDSERQGAAPWYIHEADITAVRPTPGLAGRAARMQERLLDALYSSRLSSDSKAFVAAVLLGDRSALSPDTGQVFARAGLSHILALSGLHVAIIVGMLYWLLTPIVLTGHRHIRTVLLLAAIWWYAVVTGCGAPVMRAAIMASAALLADLTQRRADGLNSLCVAATVMLLLSPTLIADVGFQMSFVAVAGIILFARPLNPFADSRRRLLRAGGNIVSASLAAMLGAGVIAAVRFHTFPLLFIVANAAVAPLVVPLILGGGIAVVAGEMAGTGVFGWLIWCVDALVEFTEAAAAAIGSISWSALDVRGPGIVAISIFFLLAVMVGLTLRSGKAPSRRVKVASAAAAIAVLVASLTTDSTVAQEPPGSVLAVRNSSDIELIVAAPDTLYLVSTAPPTAAEAHRDYLSAVLERYMRDRGIAALVLAADEVNATGFARRGHRLMAGNRMIMIADSLNPAPLRGGIATDIVIIGKNFRGSVSSLDSALAPGEIWISRSLYLRQRTRYTDSIRAAGRPVVYYP